MWRVKIVRLAIAAAVAVGQDQVFPRQRNPFGAEFPSSTDATLRAVAAQRNYSSPFWMTQKQAEAMGVHAKDGEQGTKLNGKWSFELFNAEQTSNPSLFSEETCVPFSAMRPTIAMRPLTRQFELLRLRTFAASKGFKSTLWLTANEVKERGGELLEGATGVSLPQKGGSTTLHLYNADETSVPPKEQEEFGGCDCHSNS